MSKNIAFIPLIVLFFAVTISLVSAAPLIKSTTNPRYFSQNNNIVYLTGSHTWGNLQDYWDYQTYGSNSYTFTYTNFLDTLSSYNHNFFRLWTWEAPKGDGSGVDNYTVSPLPYVRTGTTNAQDGLPKIDLNTFNDSYFTRLKDRVSLAQSRGFYISVMLFDGWSIESKFTGHTVWKYHPFNSLNNINGINGDTNNNNQGEEMHSSPSSEILSLQQAYVRKVIDTVNEFDNIMYEISNESGSNSQTWQYNMINYIKQYEQTKAKQHPVGMTVEYPGGSNTDLYNSPADWISPNGDLYNRPLATGNKVIIADTDHLCGLCGDRKWVWSSFTRGENPIFMDAWGFTNDQISTYIEIRRNLGYTKNYAQRLNLALTTPSNTISSTGYALVNPNSQYLVYQPNSGSFTVNLTSATGTYSVEWLNPNTGTTQNGTSIQAGTTRTLTPPFSGDAVVFLNSLGITPTQTPSPSPIPSPSPTLNSQFDVNEDGKVDLRDVIDLIAEIFK